MEIVEWCGCVLNEIGWRLLVERSIAKTRTQFAKYAKWDVESSVTPSGAADEAVSIDNNNQQYNNNDRNTHTSTYITYTHTWTDETKNTNSRAKERKNRKYNGNK